MRLGFCAACGASAGRGVTRCARNRPITLPTPQNQNSRQCQALAGKFWFCGEMGSCEALRRGWRGLADWGSRVCWACWGGLFPECFLTAACA